MKTKRPPTTSVSIRLKPDEMKLLREAAGAVRIDLYATDVLRRHLTNKLVDEALEAVEQEPAPERHVFTGICSVCKQSFMDCECPEVAMGYTAGQVQALGHKPTQETGLTPALYDWLGNQLHDDFAYKLWRLLEAFRAGETMPRRGV